MFSKTNFPGTSFSQNKTLCRKKVFQSFLPKTSYPENCPKILSRKNLRQVVATLARRGQTMRTTLIAFRGQLEGLRGQLHAAEESANCRRLEIHRLAAQLQAAPAPAPVQLTHHTLQRYMPTAQRVTLQAAALRASFARPCPALARAHPPQGSATSLPKRTTTATGAISSDRRRSNCEWAAAVLFALHH